MVKRSKSSESKDKNPAADTPENSDNNQQPGRDPAIKSDDPPSEGDEITGGNSKWKQYPFNGHYASSVFASQDPVDIDPVGADFLMNEPTVTFTSQNFGAGQFDRCKRIFKLTMISCVICTVKAHALTRTEGYSSAV